MLSITTAVAVRKDDMVARACIDGSVAGGAEWLVGPSVVSVGSEWS